MLKRSFVPALIVLALVLFVGLSQVQGAQDDVKAKMSEKMDLAKGLMEGLATGNLANSAKGAQRLAAITAEVNWDDLAKNTIYNNFARQFKSVTKSLAEAVTKKDVETAQSYYKQMLTTCFGCHNVIRPMMAK